MFQPPKHVRLAVCERIVPAAAKRWLHNGRFRERHCFVRAEYSDTGALAAAHPWTARASNTSKWHSRTGDLGRRFSPTVRGITARVPASGLSEVAARDNPEVRPLVSIAGTARECSGRQMTATGLINVDERCDDR